MLPPEDVSGTEVEHEQTAGRAPASYALNEAVGGQRFTVASRVLRAGLVRPYERRPGDPVFRPLRIYASDPVFGFDRTAVAIVNVPYEPLLPGPVGAVIAVDDFDASRKTRHSPVDLDAPTALLESGREPSP